MSSYEKRILVVDDEATHRQLLSKVLQSVPHYQVIEVDNGLDALEALKKEHIDLILLDVNMPVMDGFETLAAIHEDEALSDVPVIMCTAVTKRGEVVRILQQGVAGYIMKPIKIEKLLPKVQEVLEAVASGQEDSAESHQTEQTTNDYLALIVDEDENFRRIVGRILNPYYDIIEVDDEKSIGSLSLNKQVQVIILGKLADTLNLGNVFSKLRPLIRQKKTRVYRVFSTASEAMAERKLTYHGKMIRTLDIHILRSRLRKMMVLPDFTISRQKSVVVVALKNYYPQEDEENRMLLRTIAMAVGSDALDLRFDLSDWESESTEALEIASPYLEDIITEFKSLDINIEIIGYTPPKGSLLADLLTDQLAESQQKYIDYLTPRITKLQQHCKVEDVEAIVSVASDLNNFGKEHGLSQISLLADMLIRESNKNHWDVVKASIEQLLREQKKIEENSV